MLTALHEVNGFKDGQVLYLVADNLLVKVAGGLTGVGAEAPHVARPGLQQRGQAVLYIAHVVLYIRGGGLGVRPTVGGRGGRTYVSSHS